jgi:hypothetical protein
VYGSAVPLADRWNRVEEGLDPRWTEVTLSLAIKDDAARSRAAALLGPAGPGVGSKEIRFGVSTQGAGIGPEAARRLLRKIDAEGIVGRLELVESHAAPPEPEQPARSLAEAWREALEKLPSDWSDLVAELDLDSSADLDRGAVLCAPINPQSIWLEASPAKPAMPGQRAIGTPSASRGARPAFRFRCASRSGYGASAGMVGRCLARLDEAGITGRVRITRALSDVNPVGTQGATFTVGRRPA